MQVQSLGHVVLKVRNRERSEHFYSDVLGIPVVSRISEPARMSFFSLGNHHDFAVVEVGDQAPAPDALATGLAHVAFKLWGSIEELRSVRTDLESAGITILYAADRAYTRSLHLQDPDGNEVELYIDTSDEWKADPQAVNSA
jgi:catechol-2,3-dioxygenase